jgi:hypothetical protein
MTLIDPPRLQEFRCADDVSLPSAERLRRLHDRIVAPAPARRSGRLLAALIAIAVLAASMSVLAKTFLRRPTSPTAITVPAGSEVHLERQRRFGASVTGPATAEVGAGDDGTLALTGGRATVNADEQPVKVAVGQVSAMVSPFAAAEVVVATEGDTRITARGGAVTVRPRGAPAVVLNGGESWRASPPGGSGRASAEPSRKLPSRLGGAAPAVAEPEPFVPPPFAPAEVSALAWRKAGSAAKAAAAEAGPAVAPAAPRPAASAILRQALERLRGARDPGAALALVEAHRSDLEAGSLAAEGDLVRLEALLALGRRDEAAQLLEAIDVPTSRRDLHLLRGELRAAEGRCTDAVADFQVARRPRPGDELDQRALHGQAVCLSRLGARARARAVLEEYLARYPAGSFAVEARRAMED